MKWDGHPNLRKRPRTPAKGQRHWCEPAAPGSKLCKGAEALETLYKEKPGEYLRLTASMPREFIFENVTLELLITGVENSQIACGGRSVGISQ
jgi:hypothetical protein